MAVLTAERGGGSVLAQEMCTTPDSLDAAINGWPWRSTGGDVWFVAGEQNRRCEILDKTTRTKAVATST